VFRSEDRSRSSSPPPRSPDHGGYSSPDWPATGSRTSGSAKAATAVRR